MALRSIKTAATAITEAGVLQFITDLLKFSGIFDVQAGHFAVTAGSGLSINIATGRAYLLAPSGGNGYPVINDAAITNKAIASNATGNPRISTIVLYKDLTISANSDDTNTTFILEVLGTAASSPVPPSNSTIQAAVGAGNPYTPLNNVRVNSGATAPTSLTDVRQQVGFRNDIFNQDQWVVYNPTAASTLTLDLSLGKKFQINLPNGAVTLALLNVPLNCKSIVLRFTQPSSGAGTVTYFAGLSWPNSVVPTLSGVNKSDEFGVNFLTVTNDSTNTSEGVPILQN